MTEAIATDPIITVTDLSVTFATPRGPVHAVRGVDMVVAPGETVGIVGESGSGKSTLARAIVGLVPAESGSAFVDGRPVRPLRGRRSRVDAGTVQMIFQDSYTSLNPRQRPIDAVAEAVRVCQGLGRAPARERALHLLGSVGISPAQSRMKTRSLSGGQRQRVSIARALAADPKILVADEPTSSLDQSIAASLLNLLRRIQAERGITVVFISHDLGVVRYLAHRVYVMKEGVIVEHGLTADVFGAPEHEYTRTLVSSVPGVRSEAA
ncbi:ATP-binding cassette domain-containing protein [Asanoa sp. NPDC050611]|uniref:ABC transporter ATP-binding protein n=1 Tax=Asanoa sp. NPDC050611 TaxID=3157098 RepID=UPI0033F6B356